MFTKLKIFSRRNLIIMAVFGMIFVLNACNYAKNNFERDVLSQENKAAEPQEKSPKNGDQKASQDDSSPFPAGENDDYILKDLTQKNTELLTELSEKNKNLLDELSTENQKILEKISQKDEQEKVEKENERIALTPNNIQEYLPSTYQEQITFFESFNTDPSSTGVPFSDGKRGISLEIPYSEKWGNEKFKFKLFDEVNDSLYFGHPVLTDSSVLQRAFSLELREAQTEKEILQDFRDVNAEVGQSIFVSSPKKIAIGSLSAFEYELKGICPKPTILVLGEKYNYEFSSGMTCGKLDDIRKIAETAKLI